MWLFELLYFFYFFLRLRLEVPFYSQEEYRRLITLRARKLAKRYSEDVIFVFRRKLKIELEGLTAAELLSTQQEHIVHISFQGLLYLARQKRVLALKGNEKMDQFSGSTSPELRAERWRKLAGDGLKKLAQEARKVLHSHKFEKRQSAY